MRYLGLDVGTKSVGVALSDRTNSLASPLKTIFFTEESQAINEVKTLIEQYNITNVVIGLPKNMDNSMGFASKRSLDFKELLEKESAVKIEFMDERLTTILAQNVLLDYDMSRKKRKKVVDKIAACIILNDYLKMKGKKE